MLYNTAKKKIKVVTDCPLCPHFDKKNKKCNGLNRVCFEYDPTTQTIIDGKTKLPRKI